ncbi:ABC transporter substrate-binding protein [Aromatoleum toluclasticum]|uniref:ABC transporter substrate-binding protein n=1 Tax=Aromatoleum toluclasticum TaxID=92003 RepID=UPI001D1909D5|nr:ABC transporter substrate-binding protein [Aromatoleum toluclasticum]MCC4113960.1 ABC transporter substrate-binding protein [Aromatoleum toluclasticum]
MNVVVRGAGLARLAGMIVGTLLVGTAAAQEVGVTADEILLGEIQPMSGPASLIGKAGAAGSKLAIAEINAAGGINGRKLRAIYEDDGYVPARSVTALKKLMETDRIFALTGTTGSSHMMAMMPTIATSDMPTIVHMAPNPLVVTPRRPNVFMIGPDYDRSAFVPLRYIAKQMGKRDAKFAVLYQDDDFGKALLAGYRQVVAELGLNSVAEIPFKRGAKDFSSEVLRLKSVGATVLFNGALTTEAAAVLSEARRLGLDLTVATSWANQLPAALKLAAPAGYNYLIADYYASNYDEAGKTLLSRASQFLSSDDQSNFNRYTVSGYVGTKVLAEGIRRCGQNVTRACVTQALGGLQGFSVDGLSGPISLNNPKGQAVLPVKVYAVDTKTQTMAPLTDFVVD